MLVGFATAIVLMLASAGGIFEIAIPVAGMIANLLAVITALVVSLLSPAPSPGALEAARDMRIPGGETVYDREMRQLKFAQREQV